METNCLRRDCHGVWSPRAGRPVCNDGFSHCDIFPLGCQMAKNPVSTVNLSKTCSGKATGRVGSEESWGCLLRQQSSKASFLDLQVCYLRLFSVPQLFLPVYCFFHASTELSSLRWIENGISVRKDWERRRISLTNVPNCNRKRLYNSLRPITWPLIALLWQPFPSHHGTTRIMDY